MKIVVLNGINSMWIAARPQKGRFEILPFGDRTVGWVFKPDEPHMENYVGFRGGFKDEDEALEDLKQFVARRLKHS